MDVESFKAVNGGMRAEMLAGFPKSGAKLRYRGVHPFWFTDIIQNAERELRIGTVYTLNKREVASSWVAITLQETGDTQFALSFFEEVAE